MENQNQNPSPYDEFEHAEFEQYRLTDKLAYDPDRQNWPQKRLTLINDVIRHYSPERHMDLHREKNVYLEAGKAFDPWIFARSAGFSVNENIHGQRFATLKADGYELTISRGYHLHKERGDQITLTIRKAGQTQHIQAKLPQSFADFYRLLADAQAPVNQRATDMTKYELAYRQAVTRPEPQPKKQLSFNEMLNPHLYK